MDHTVELHGVNFLGGTKFWGAPNFGVGTKMPTPKKVPTPKCPSQKILNISRRKILRLEIFEILSIFRGTFLGVTFLCLPQNLVPIPKINTMPLIPFD